MSDNTHLIAAKTGKDDEFYTTLPDVEAELAHYGPCLRGKTVYCNCDTVPDSAFWTFLHTHFSQLGLKRLLATGLAADGCAKVYAYDGGCDAEPAYCTRISDIPGNGDFRSKACRSILAKADTVITNPPFSLFTEFLVTLISAHKEFLVIGPLSAVSYIDVFPHIRNGAVTLGYSRPSRYLRPDGRCAKLGNTYWYTNIPVQKHHAPMLLTASYTADPDAYPHFTNYDGILVRDIRSIPADYDGPMAVPLTFLEHFCPEQFEILGLVTGCKFMENPVMLGEGFIKAYAKQNGTGHYSENMYGIYYTDAAGHVHVPFSRILVQHKTDTHKAGQEISRAGPVFE